jgi:hypothetical protein
MESEGSLPRLQKPATGTYRILVGRPEGKRPLERPRRRWENNIKLNLREIEIDGGNWIQLVQCRIQWRAFAITVMNLRVQKRKQNIFLIS